MALILNILLATLYLVMNDPKILTQGRQQVPCLFFFGDSVFDNGNNNFLRTTLKANYLPYGVDYPGGPTGRFSNGRNKADFLAELLGFQKPIPPFASAKGLQLLKGVNYASGGAGIRNETGQHLGDRFTLNGQLMNHKVTKRRIARLLKDPTKANLYLNKCLYVVYIGSDDYVNNYNLPKLYPTSRLFTPEQFATSLIHQLKGKLKTLYGYGARKIAVFELGLLGCLPQEIAMFPTHGLPCVDFINKDVQLFNSKLKPLADNLNKNLPGAQLIYINTTGIDSSALGFTVTNATCCRVVHDAVCIPDQVPCSDRAKYLFYDNIHPVEAFDQAIAARAYRAKFSSDAYPFDIERLALH